MSAPNRRKTYKSYWKSTEDGERQLSIPYHTLRRWRLQGKCNEEVLKKHGILFKNKRGVQPNPASEATCSSAATPPTPIGSQECSSAVSIVCEGVQPASQERDTECISRSSSENSEDELESSNSFDNIDHKLANMSSIINSKFIGPSTLNEPLHPSLSVNKFETMMMIMHLSMRHKMTDVFLEDMLKFVNLFVGIPDTLTVSKHLFHKLFMCGSNATSHFYCPNCSIYLGSKGVFPNGTVNCNNCDWIGNVLTHNEGNFFITLGLREQIRDILSRPDIKFVQRDRLDNIISDMMDGKMYRAFSHDGHILSNRDALTLTFNTDGAPVFNSGPNSLWPVHFYINEIDLSQRFSVDNVLLGGLWFGKNEANFQLLLKPVVEELKELQKRGVVWKRGDGTVIESPIYAICCCTDSLAKPNVAQLNHFSGDFGCGYCEHPNTYIKVIEEVKKKTGVVVRRHSGEQVDQVQAVSEDVIIRRRQIMRYLNGEHKLRTNKELREYMMLAASTQRYGHIMGATGVSVLCELNYFNTIHSFGVDYLRDVLLGIVKSLASLWFDSTSHGKPYYIGLQIGRVDARLQGLTLIKGFQVPRSMTDRHHWKASEWRSFLLYFALPVLDKILPLPYYKNFGKLSSAVYTLCKDSILHEELDDAHKLLLEFVDEYQELYGEYNMIYDVHIVKHLARVASNLGPAFCYSAFPFEGANGRLVKLARRTTGTANQISRKYIMTKSIPKLLRHNYKVTDKVVNFCCDMIGYKYLKHSIKRQSNEMLSGRQFYFSLSDRQKEVCRKLNLPGVETVLAVNRAVVKGTPFCGRLTCKQRKDCDSCIRLNTGEFALIDLIFLMPGNARNDVTFLVTKLNIATDPSPLMLPHIKECSLDCFGEQALIKSDDIVRKCIFYASNDHHFVVEIANFYETD